MAIAAACVARASSSTSVEKWAKGIVPGIDVNAAATAGASIQGRGHLQTQTRVPICMPSEFAFEALACLGLFFTSIFLPRP